MKPRELFIRTPVLAALLCSMLTGCLVGPNFERPQASTPDVFDRTHSAQAASKPVQTELSPDWWTLFNDPTLDALERQLADANLDVAAASARLRQSRASNALPARKNIRR